MRPLIIRGDAQHLPLADGTVDAIVCDPPYGLEFMGRDWDSFRPAAARIRTREDGRTNPTTGRSTTRTPEAYVAGHPFQQWCQDWATEALRVLKPGGHLLAFGGTRTYHRLTCAIEDAGFEIRDSIGVLGWVYASGFPKSLDVSKAIDKARDDRDATLAVTSWVADHADAKRVTRGDVDRHFGTSDMGGWWLSRLRHRCVVPTWDQWQALRVLLDLPDDMDAEVWRLNGRKGTPGDAWAQRPEADYQSRPGMAQSWTDGHGWTGTTARGGTGILQDATRWQGWGTALKPAWEPIVVARKPLAGTVAANVLAYGTGAINVDGCRLPAGDEQFGGRWPTNLVLVHHPDCADQCTPGCPAAELDAQSGIRTSGSWDGKRSRPKFGHAYGEFNGGDEPARLGDTGGASRFYPQFRFNPKADTAERPVLTRPDGTILAHPTVKPVDLMRWLVRLVTPPGGLVLDPFAGSGATLQAAAIEGFRAVGVELDADHCALARERLSWPVRIDPDGTFRRLRPPPPPAEGQGDLFADPP